MSAQDQQRAEWEAFTAAQHAKGLCEFSGLRVGRCVASVCDCFETPEGAAEIERRANEAAQRELTDKFANHAEVREAAIDEIVRASGYLDVASKYPHASCGCFPHGPDEPCTCDGCWACGGGVVGCTCDVDWGCEHGGDAK